jgi:hypothetical protein
VASRAVLSSTELEYNRTKLDNGEYSNGYVQESFFRRITREIHSRKRSLTLKVIIYILAVSGRVDFPIQTVISAPFSDIWKRREIDNYYTYT